MNVKSEIKEAILKVVQELGVEGLEIKLEHPSDLEHGDYSSNIAFAIFSNSKFKIQNSKFNSPRELAEEIVEKFRIHSSEFKIMEKIEVAGGGFVNFWLSKDFLLSSLSEIKEQEERFGTNESFKDKKVMIEYTDPNPFKEFHIGHLYSNCVGETLSRIYQAQGAEVKRANYQGDVGMHVAKAIYGLLQTQNSKLKTQNLDKESLKKRIEVLGRAYVEGAAKYETDESVKKEINEINKKIYEKSDPQVQKIYELGRQWSLDYFEIIYKRLGTKFDYYYFESIVGVIGAKLVKEYLDKGIFEKSEGAIIFPGEKYGLHNRVFINSLGFPTYEAKELGLNKKKFEDYAFDLSVIVTGSEINEYFKVLFCAMEKVIPEVTAKTKHIGHGMVRLPQGKMSSRTGNVISGEWLLDEVKDRICLEFKEMDEETSEMVAVGAIKYAMLKSSVGKDIEFSFEESISFEGNSGPYLQYTYARTRSVMRKCHSERSEESPIKRSFGLWPQDDINKEELIILRLLYRFPEVVEEAAVKYSPNYIASYLYELASNFNLFYQKHKILESESKDFRLALTASVGQILYNGLYMLGIEAPQRM